MTATRSSLPPNTDAADGPARKRGRLGQQEDEVFERIQQAILDHRLPPGTKLKEVPLAETFGVTRGLLRKVLTRLAHARLVDQRPNRGAKVASPSISESRDLFAARRAIEGAIVDIACRRIGARQIRTLRKMIEREQQAYRKDEVRAGLKLSIDFHRVLAEMAGNTVLAGFLDELLTRTPLVILAYKDTRATATGCDCEDHGAIADALEAGDADAAVQIMQKHLEELEGQLNLREEDSTTDLSAIFSR
ncbi:MAG: GntR family transcriptional regulator [Rhodocyclaceae bacterium]|nr:GntR family transcriptional regulator [Rhodocyclaceae bacterium]MCP5239781.1 GntR family transcriptional regulator [Zoogloeaceae bacterium]MCB1910977.1 GntR family transcriptional regulator [Rhodocyclaceae bacterium]MCP5253982.1 GntR family transcriptional regulator [Zoogloeaceae bacterium]MCP5293626.1 GntR family transcriptional regulator [Zoogloeaceae bacterium]